MTIEESKLEILRGVEQGKLSIDEGAHLLEILDGKSTEQGLEPVSGAVLPPHEKLDVSGGWRMLWGIVLWIGLVFLGLTGWWLYSSYARSGMGVGFWFALFFLMISCFIMYIGYELMASKHWLVVRVREEDKKKIDIWVPLPLRLANWVFDSFGSYMPEEVPTESIRQMLDEMENDREIDEPYIIDVDGKEGVTANIRVEC